MDLKDKIAVVTGGSRGVGKGIAIGLAELGAHVYITGRTENGTESGLPDFLKNTSINHTAQLIRENGGLCTAIKCDHSHDEETKAVFNLIYEKHGRLDILVNNAWGGSMHAMQAYYFKTPFWEQPISIWDDHYSVGVRSNYVASWCAAKIMKNQSKGLIVNISYLGGERYMNNVSYGVCKATVDRMTRDMAEELKEYGVVVNSIYPGVVRTEGMIEYAKYDKNCDISTMESPIDVGKCIGVLYSDSNGIDHTGEVIKTIDLKASNFFI